MLSDFPSRERNVQFVTAPFKPLTDHWGQVKQAYDKAGYCNKSGRAIKVETELT